MNTSESIIPQLPARAKRTYRYLETRYVSNPHAQPVPPVWFPRGIPALKWMSLRECFKFIPLSLIHSDRCINGYQHCRCNSQWTSKQRGRYNAVGKVCTVYIARLPVFECRRLVANALNESVTELRKDNDTRMSQYVHTEPPE